MVQTSVRSVTAADLAKLQAIEDDADTLFESLFSTADWQSAPPGGDRAGRPGFILVASDSPDSVALGFVHVVEISGGDHLEQLSVRPSAARRGHGRALVEAAIAASRRRGRARISLRTYADVPWNAPFYASCGFVEAAPDTDFLRELVVLEQLHGLDQGRRVQMTHTLTEPR